MNYINDLMEENDIKEELQEVIKEIGNWLADIEYKIKNYEKEEQCQLREDLEEIKTDLLNISKKELNSDEKYVITRFKQRIENAELELDNWNDTNDVYEFYGISESDFH